MAKSLILRFIPVVTPDGITIYESNMVQVNGASGVHLEMGGVGNSVTTLRSMTGANFVSSYQDYFGEISDFFIGDPGIGQAYKIKLNNPPLFGIITGDVEDMGDINPENPEEMVNAFADINGNILMGSDGQYFFVKNQLN